MNTLESQDSYLQPFFQMVGTLLGRLPSVLVGFLVGVLIIRFSIRFVKWLMKLTHLEPGLRQILVSVIELTMWMFLLVAILQGLGFSNVILFFTSSVAAFAIIMAAGGSTLISDIFAGIFLAQDRDFRVGDRVIAGPDKTEGHIIRIDARRIRIRDDDGKVHVLPNTLVERSEWVVIEQVENLAPIEKVKHTARKISKVVKKNTQNALK